jgi:hypothetical protein
MPVAAVWKQAGEDIAGEVLHERDQRHQAQRRGIGDLTAGEQDV